MSGFVKEFINGNFKAAVKSIADAVIPISPATYHTPDAQNDWWLEIAQGNFHYFSWQGYRSAAYAYEVCPPVSAIINAKAQALVKGQTWVLNGKDKVIERSNPAQAINKLLARPNPIQSWAQFEAQTYIFQQLFGFAIILPIKPAGYSVLQEPLDTEQLWNIPASWLEINETREAFNRNGGVLLDKVVVNFRGSRVEFKVSELIIIKDFSPSLNTITFPASRLIAQALPINNIIGALESRNMLINYRGALGILSGDPVGGQYTPIPLQDDDKKQLQRDFRQYGLKKNQFQVIMTNAQLKWQQMGFATKDLMLMEEVEESTRMICNGLNFPPFILGLADTTYNNMDAAEKALYQRSVIPDGHSIYQQLTAWFKLERFGLRIDKDYSEIEVLQEEKKSAAEARKFINQARRIEWRNGFITLNEWRVALGEDPMKDERGKLYFPEYVALYGDPDKSGKNGQEGTEGSNDREDQGSETR